VILIADKTAACGGFCLRGSRFSVAFRDFLLEVYNKPVVDINDEDLAQIKYLRIERQKKTYHFTYSFEDYYDYTPKILKTIQKP
jgi:hypothetical protein